MLAAVSRLLPAAAQFTRQIIPARDRDTDRRRADLRLQPCLFGPFAAAAHGRAASGAGRDAGRGHCGQRTKPLAATEAVAIYDNVAPPPRLWEKEARQDAGKDQTIRIAEPAPVPVRTAAPRAEPKSEPRAEPRHVAAVELPPRCRARAGAGRCGRAALSSRCRHPSCLRPRPPRRRRDAGGAGPAPAGLSAAIRAAAVSAAAIWTAAYAAAISSRNIRRRSSWRSRW